MAPALVAFMNELIAQAPPTDRAGVLALAENLAELVYSWGGTPYECALLLPADLYELVAPLQRIAGLNVGGSWVARTPELWIPD